MCTIGYHRDLGVLFKNRDKTSLLVEEVIQNERIITCRTAGSDYYSWGMNAYGCTFVTAAINSPRWTSLVYEGKTNDADELYRRENEALTNPVTLVSNMLPDVRSIEPWVKAITLRPLLAMGYNILLADRKQAVVVEAFRDKRHIRQLQAKEAVTNHFQALDHGPQVSVDYPSSFRRYEYASRLLSSATNKTDVWNLLKPEDREQRQQIWRSGPFITISTSILDFQNGQAYYARDIDKKKISLELQKNKQGE